jgi:phenylacetate-CoA ligase
LKKTVHLVYDNVPFYKKKFKELKITPNNIKTLNDARILPFTTKDDLRNNAPFGMMATSLDNCIELHASSGTTGIPITVCYTRNDIEVWSEIMARCLSMSGLTKKIFSKTRYHTEHLLALLVSIMVHKRLVR